LTKNATGLPLKSGIRVGLLRYQQLFAKLGLPECDFSRCRFTAFSRRFFRLFVAGTRPRAGPLSLAKKFNKVRVTPSQAMCSYVFFRRIPERCSMFE
jgi:hypothetical protein